MVSHDRDVISDLECRQSIRRDESSKMTPRDRRHQRRDRQTLHTTRRVCDSVLWCYRAAGRQCQPVDVRVRAGAEPEERRPRLKLHELIDEHVVIYVHLLSRRQQQRCDDLAVIMGGVDGSAGNARLTLWLPAGSTSASSQRTRAVSSRRQQGGFGAPMLSSRSEHRTAQPISLTDPTSNKAAASMTTVTHADVGGDGLPPGSKSGMSVRLS